ncbi:hypothetical protein [Paenibacillus sp. 79R4]|nr:hypothetical protein [Paenibacillus sp. 79R4]
MLDIGLIGDLAALMKFYIRKKTSLGIAVAYPWMISIGVSPTGDFLKYF